MGNWRSAIDQTCSVQSQIHGRLLGWVDSMVVARTIPLSRSPDGGGRAASARRATRASKTDCFLLPFYFFACRMVWFLFTFVFQVQLISRRLYKSRSALWCRMRCAAGGATIRFHHNSGGRVAEGSEAQIGPSGGAGGSSVIDGKNLDSHLTLLAEWSLYTWRVRGNDSNAKQFLDCVEDSFLLDHSPRGAI